LPIFLKALNTQGVIKYCSGEPITINDFMTNYLWTKESNSKLNKGIYPYPDYEPMKFWGIVDKLN
jgi:hypothetical protein